MATPLFVTLTYDVVMPLSADFRFDYFATAAAAAAFRVTIFATPAITLRCFHAYAGRRHVISICGVYAMLFHAMLLFYARR